MTQSNLPFGPIFTSSAKRFLTLLVLSLASLGLWPRLWTHPSLWVSWLFIQSIMPSFLFIIYFRALKSLSAQNKTLSYDIKFNFTIKQMIQQLAQVSIYVGLSIHWPQMREQLPLTLAQVLFAYQLDIIWVWLKKSSQYRLSLSPTPIILSINLFIWFKDSVFYWQWLLIVFAIFSRFLFTYEEKTTKSNQVHKELRIKHNIFNPSALAISVAGLLLIVTRSTHITWGESLAIQHGAGDYAYWTIFAAGFLAQFFVPIAWITLSGTLSYLALDTLYFQQFNSYQFIDTAIPPAVFLGLNLLITDPRTIPKKRVGQISYGIAYACLSFICFSLLKLMAEPAQGTVPTFNPIFLDKALAIPLLNLSVPLINRLSSSRPSIKHEGINKLTMSLCWLLLFTFYVHPKLKEHPGKKLIFWIDHCQKDMDQSAPVEDPTQACQVRDHLLALQCESGNLKLCHNLAVSPWTTPKRAQYLLENSCQKGLDLSCVILGEQSYEQALQMRKQNLSPQQVLPLVEKAQILWESACGLQDDLVKSTDLKPKNTLDTRDRQQSAAQACFHLANLLATPWARAPQISKALLCLERACQYGMQQACKVRSQY